METKVISFYDNFTCLAKDCPNTCCRGWRISIDEDTVNKYRNEPGELGKKLRCSMTLGQDKDIRKIFGKCANETKEGLCKLQLMNREDLMPKVCRIYPRRSVAIGDKEEVTFELSCPKTAELFLQDLSRPKLVEYEGDEILPVWSQEVFDKDLLKLILKLREQIIDYIYDTKSMPEVIHNVYKYYRYMHDEIMKGANSVISISEFVSDLPSKDRWRFYSMSLFDKIIMNDIDDGFMSLRNALYGFSREYDKIFGKMTAEDANFYFEKMCKQMVAKYPALEDKYRAYLAYYVLQTMYSGYETCTFLDECMLGQVYLQMLITVDLVDYLNGRDMENVNRAIENLNKCEKRLRHNLGIKKSISKRINEEFSF